MSCLPKRMIVTGTNGQVVRSLLERGALGNEFEVVALGRPYFDLSASDSIEMTLRAANPDVIVSAAAFTNVDLAESNEETATLVNGIAAGLIAKTAKSLDIPIIHISTDYVFDGHKSSPYVETDLASPLGAYGRSKHAGETAVSRLTSNHVILRTAWVYSPYGRNFLTTMLKLAQTRDCLNVVDDQMGNPTSALDIADGVLRVAVNLLNRDDPELRGIFHMTGLGDVSWAGFAAEIFAAAERWGLPSATIVRIPSTQYPTPAQRPANSRLNCEKLHLVHGVRLPDWKQSTETVIKRLAREERT